MVTHTATVRVVPEVGGKKRGQQFALLNILKVLSSVIGGRASHAKYEKSHLLIGGGLNKKSFRRILDIILAAIIRLAHRAFDTYLAELAASEGWAGAGDGSWNTRGWCATLFNFVMLNAKSPRGRMHMFNVPLWKEMRSGKNGEKVLLQGNCDDSTSQGHEGIGLTRTLNKLASVPGLSQKCEALIFDGDLKVAKIVREHPAFKETPLLNDTGHKVKHFKKSLSKKDLLGTSNSSRLGQLKRRMGKRFMTLRQHAVRKYPGNVGMQRREFAYYWAMTLSHYANQCPADDLCKYHNPEDYTGGRCGETVAQKAPKFYLDLNDASDNALAARLEPKLRQVEMDSALFCHDYHTTAVENSHFQRTQFVEKGSEMFKSWEGLAMIPAVQCHYGHDWAFAVLHEIGGDSITIPEAVTKNFTRFCKTIDWESRRAQDVETKKRRYVNADRRAERRALAKEKQAPDACHSSKRSLDDSSGDDSGDDGPRTVVVGVVGRKKKKARTAAAAPSPFADALSCCSCTTKRFSKVCGRCLSCCQGRDVSAPGFAKCSVAGHKKKAVVVPP